VLITFCASAALAAALALAVLFASATLVFAGAQSVDASGSEAARNLPVSTDASSTQSFAGMITDERCSARHLDSARSSAECVRMCAGNGVKYSLIDGDKKYRLEGMSDQLGVVAAQRARISGTLNAGTIKVSAVTPDSSTQP
jgi:hypothetical protein